MTAFIRESWTLRSGSGSSKSSPAKRRRGGCLSPTIIPFLWASSMTTAEQDGRQPRLQGRTALAILCVACGAVGTQARGRIGRPHSGARDRELDCQRSRGSSCGAGKRDRRPSHRPRRRTWGLRDHAAWICLHAKEPTERERSEKRDRPRHDQRHADRDCSGRVDRRRGAGSGLDAALDPSVVAPSPRDHPGRERRAATPTSHANESARRFHQGVGDARRWLDDFLSTLPRPSSRSPCASAQFG